MQLFTPRGIYLCFFLFFFNLIVYFFLFLKILVSYFWLHCVFVARGLSLVATSGGYSSLWCTGFSLRWLLFLAEHGL